MDEIRDVIAVDAAVVRLAYQMAGNACKPATDLTSVSNALRVWTDNIESPILQDISKEGIIKGLDNLKLSADFIGEAAIDSVQCSARSMLHTVMAKRALWLKPWLMDVTSKQNWYKIPFDGKALFGRNWIRPSLASQVENQACYPKTDDPGAPGQGKSFRQNWRSTQSTFLKTRRQRPLSTPKDPENLGTKVQKPLGGLQSQIQSLLDISRQTPRRLLYSNKGIKVPSKSGNAT